MRGKTVVKDMDMNIRTWDMVLGCVCLEVKYGGWKTLEKKWE